MSESIDIYLVLKQACAWVFETLLPFTPSSRLHWTGLVTFFVLGAGIYLASKDELNANGESGFFQFLFPRHMYFSRSSGVDLKLYFGNKLFTPIIDSAGFILQVLIITGISKVISGTLHPETSGTLAWPALVLATLAATLARDFGYYINHKLHHENSYLWPFHKLHHSAEYLTPITAFRNHPVFDLGLRLSVTLFSAPVIGVIFGVFGLHDEVSIFGVALFVAMLNFSGGAFRHSHIWLDFGPVFSRIFISPAQHQIHHSMAPHHHNKNYGLIFAFWDGLFGTLYIPRGREDLTFGVADANGIPLQQVHNTLLQSWSVPFTEFAHVREQKQIDADSRKKEKTRHSGART